VQGKDLENCGVGVINLFFETYLLSSGYDALLLEGHQPAHVFNSRNLLLHIRTEQWSKQAMNILIGRKVNLPTQPVNPLPCFNMFIISLLVTHMGIDQKDAGKSKGKTKDAQYRV